MGHICFTLQKHIGSALSLILSYLLYTKNIGNKWKTCFFGMKGDIGIRAPKRRKQGVVTQ